MQTLTCRMDGNKILLQSPGKYGQSSRMNHKQKECVKTESLLRYSRNEYDIVGQLYFNK